MNLFEKTTHHMYRSNLVVWIEVLALLIFVQIFIKSYFKMYYHIKLQRRYTFSRKVYFLLIISSLFVICWFLNTQYRKFDNVKTLSNFNRNNLGYFSKDVHSTTGSSTNYYYNKIKQFFEITQSSIKTSANKYLKNDAVEYQITTISATINQSKEIDQFSRDKHNLVKTSNNKNLKTHSIIISSASHDKRMKKSMSNLEMKYILLWTNPDDSPFVYFGEGQLIFKNKKCRWTNCYVTGNRNYLGDYTEFDIVAFNGPRLIFMSNNDDLPRRRSAHQKYVYANIESAAYYPLCTKVWNNFFNWTWTYKLDSDANWGYMVIRNATHHIIGPSKHMNWLNLYDMDPIDNQLKFELKSKKKAAAWFVSNCNTLSLREEFVKEIQFHLRKFSLEIDIYGRCGERECPSEIMYKCLKMIQNDYYFFFAFENSLSEDYVTEKVVYALNHNTVPVVFGGANYSRFMPHGIYVNALELGPEKLAKKMYEIIQNPAAYYNFFRWKKYYSYHFRNESPETDDYCQFCAMINDKKIVEKQTVYKNFDSWWTSNFTCKELQISHVSNYRSGKYVRNMDIEDIIDMN